MQRISGRDAYYVEQLTFALSLVPSLLHLRPDLILFSDGALGNALWWLRRLFRLSYRLLLSNGGPLDPPFTRVEHVHQLTQVEFDAALKAGEALDRMSLIPYGFHLEKEAHLPSNSDREDLRRKLQLPLDKRVLLSVGALNTSHKRMDYLLREASALNRKDLYVLLLGESEQETAAVRELGSHLFGEIDFEIRTATAADMPNYYDASDVFALCSLTEGFGRVYVEALSHGLPCLAP